MNVLNIIQCANLGGMEQASLRLMVAMQRSGIHWELLSLHPVGALSPLLEDAGIAFSGLNYCGPSGLGILCPLAAHLRKVRPDRVVMTGPHVVALLAMKLAGIRGSYLAVHFHHTGVKSTSTWRWIYRLALDRFDWITFPSDFVRDEAIAIYPPLEKRSRTLRNPQDPSPTVVPNQRQDARAALGFPQDAFVVGNAGWLIPRKRFDIFLKVAAEVAKHEPRAIFAIAGGGEEEERLKALASELGVAEKVRWLGWINDMDDFHRSLDVLLFHSDWDALGLTPQEAVAKGIPLVASVVNGGLTEILEPATARRVLKRHDVPELARQVLEIRKHPEVALKDALVCRDHLLKMTDPDEIAKEHLKLLGLPV